MRELRIAGSLPLPDDAFEEAAVVAKAAPIVNDFLKAMSAEFQDYFKMTRDIVSAKPRGAKKKAAADAKPGHVKAVP
ncbi:MAG: hypothetical protein KGL39_52270 [Patescibacteria group bacterium]|nr:hypothetical protein [Patescibacteria group bacterium]